jgi:hypothetical protein
VSQAFIRAGDLREFVVAVPKAFSPGDVKALDDALVCSTEEAAVIS